ncbi:unnamed protein product, partial [Urochloa humidicola]
SGSSLFTRTTALFYPNPPFVLPSPSLLWLLLPCSDPVAGPSSPSPAGGFSCQAERFAPGALKLEGRWDGAPPASSADQREYRFAWELLLELYCRCH